MAINLKVDIFNDAFSLLKISGITKIPTPAELDLALDRFENKMASLEGSNYGLGYNFLDDPDPNDPSNLERKYRYHCAVVLAVMMTPDFGKGATVSPELFRKESAAYSYLASATALAREVVPPIRMPRGSGNTLRTSRWWRFYSATPRVPLSSASIAMGVDDINDFAEHFDAYLNDGEDIDTYTIEADTGLTITADSNTNTDVAYTIRADGNNAENPSGVFQVKIVVTTTGNPVDTPPRPRITTRIVNFEVIDTDVIDN